MSSTKTILDPIFETYVLMRSDHINVDANHLTKEEAIDYLNTDALKTSSIDISACQDRSPGTLLFNEYFKNK